MESCERFESLIFDNVDGVVQGTQKKALVDHLNQCPACLSLSEDLKAAKLQLNSLKRLRTSQDFETVLRTRISMERSLSRRGAFQWPMKIPAYVAAGALVVVALLVVFNPSRSPVVSGYLVNPTDTFSSRSPDVVEANTSNIATQNRIESIQFPWDEVPLGKGISLDSQGWGDRGLTKPDSGRPLVDERGLHTVEF